MTAQGRAGLGAALLPFQWRCMARNYLWRGIDSPGNAARGMAGHGMGSLMTLSRCSATHGYVTPTGAELGVAGLRKAGHGREWLRTPRHGLFVHCTRPRLAARGKAGLGFSPAGLGKARHCYGASTRVAMQSVVRHGVVTWREARLPVALQGEARLGGVITCRASRPLALRGNARRGSLVHMPWTLWHCDAGGRLAWQGPPWQGVARLGMARRGVAAICLCTGYGARPGNVRHGTASHGVAKRGLAWHGMAW